MSNLTIFERNIPIKEIWMPIEGFNGLYEVSDLGNIMSFKFKDPALLKLSNKKTGYLYVDLCFFGKCKTFTVHRLVAINFIPNHENKPQVNHINGIKTDNRLCNLEWVTSSENSIHALKLGLSKKPPNHMISRIGKKHHGSKPIIQYDLNMVELNRFDSTACASRATGFNRSNIRQCLNKNNNTANVYIWRFQK